MTTPSLRALVGLWARLALAGLVACLGACGAPADPAATRGRQLLAQYQCGSCHAIPGVAASRGGVAASLDGFGRRSYIVGRFPNQPATLARWIADPAALSPATLMPDMGVSDADARAIAAYLGSLR